MEKEEAFRHTLDAEAAEMHKLHRRIIAFTKDQGTLRQTVERVMETRDSSSELVSLEENYMALNDKCAHSGMWGALSV